MSVRLMFAWYDFWIGAFYDRKSKSLYVCPLPMIVLRIANSKKRRSAKP